MSRTINCSTDEGEVLFIQDKINAAEIKDGTIKVWLNKDTPYVFNYKNKEMAKKDFAKLKEYINEEDEKSINEKLIDKACAWLKDNASNYVIEHPFSSDEAFEEDKMIEDFKKYMEE